MNKANNENVIHFIHIHARFSSREGRFGIPHGQQQFHIQ